ncbi:MAG: RdgB/HAM1 family non-canonical purine NTP pyrophosphatase [Burkholderiales bacterium]
MNRVVMASRNPGKLREIEVILAPLGIEIVSQQELGIPDADEPHFTFLENALAKARHASALGGLPALADDSGICVDALQGAPGVHSARYAGEPKSDVRNNEKLVRELTNQANRQAHYYCIMAWIRDANDPEPIIAEGAWRGEIILAPRGTNGFGYDPYFFLPKLGKTSAELDPDHKNRISHRALALRQLIQKLSTQS